MSRQINLSAVEIDSANDAASKLLLSAQKKLGFVPNMYRNMANAPHMLASYLDGYDRFRNESSFNPAEQEVVFLSISLENNCNYCMAAHSFMADNVSGVPAEVTQAIRQNRTIEDERLRALSEFTRTFVRQRGWMKREEITAFVDRGYTELQVLDILLAVSVKTLSNYANHLFNTELDEQFADWVWKA